MNLRMMVLLVFSLWFSHMAYATEAARTLQKEYLAQGVKDFSAERGKSMWSKEFTNADAAGRSCSGCHGTDLTQKGKHLKTKRPIQPMAVSANAKRYTDTKKIEKWFTRNCKWTWGRECSAQEKGDFLEYLIAQ